MCTYKHKDMKHCVYVYIVCMLASVSVCVSVRVCVFVRASEHECRLERT